MMQVPAHTPFCNIYTLQIFFILAAGLKYDQVLEQMRICLERLQLKSVDILYLHAPDHNTPIEETLSAVQKLYEGASPSATPFDMKYNVM